MLRHQMIAVLSLLLAVPSYACMDHLIAKRQASGMPIPPQPTFTVQTRVRPEAATAKVALTNVRVWDGKKVNNASTVYLNGQEISHKLSQVDETIDGNGGILLPGFWDAHAHPGNVTDLETLSSYGVTTVLNMNCQNYGFCSSMRYQTGLTSFYTAGNSAKAPGSPHAIAQNASLNTLISSPAQAQSFVNYNFGNGSDWLKIVAETDGVDQATQNALVADAHAQNKQVMTHAQNLATYIQAVISQADGPQHIPDDGLLNKTIISMMKKQNQFATPTINVFYQLLTIPGAAAAFHIPANLTFAAVYPIIKANVKALYDAGIPILAGTDSTVPYLGVDIPFGTTLHDELFFLSDSGLPNSAVLNAATSLPAQMHRLAYTGSIQPGYRADLVLLEPDADPLTQINDTRKIARVWNGGSPYLNISQS